MNPNYTINLSENERFQLDNLILSDTLTARQLKRALILIQADCGPQGSHWTVEKIIAAYGVRPLTIQQTLRSYIEGGLDWAVYRKRESYRFLDREIEDRIIALASSDPPNGHLRWSFRLLRDEFIRLGVCESISHEAVRKILKRRNAERLNLTKIKRLDRETEDIISLINSDPPNEHKRWTIRLIQEQLIRLGYSDGISSSFIWCLLKKRNIKLTDHVNDKKEAS